VETYRLFAHRWGRRLACGMLAGCLSGLVGPWRPVEAAEADLLAQRPYPVQWNASTTPRHSPAQSRLVSDVAVGHDGVLRGRVLGFPWVGQGFAPPNGRPPNDLLGHRVKLLRNGQPTAVALTRRDGRFAVQSVCGGLYQVVVDGHERPRRCFYRVWPAGAAPPGARTEMSVPLEGPIVRGRCPSPFPIMSLQQAATVTAIAVGAVAAPAIYHNALIDNRVPISP